MKKVLLGILMLFIFAVGIIGCSDDDDDDKISTNLATLTVSVGDLTFAPDTTSYAVTVSAVTTEIVIGATAVSGEATVTGTGTITLTDTVTTILVVVSANDGADTKTYTIIVTKEGGAVIVPEGVIRIHYNRDEADYEGWGLHLWNVSTTLAAISEGAIGANNWDNPITFDQTDDFGVYVDIPVINTDAQLNYIVHKGNTKDGGDTDRRFENLSDYKEFWLLQDIALAYTVKPDLLYFKSVMVTSTTTLECTSVIDVPATSEILVYRNGEIVSTDEYTLTIDGKVVTVVFNAAQNIRALFSVSLAGKQKQGTISQSLLNDETAAYDGDNLGATLNASGSVTLNFWSPVATRVEVLLYDKDDQTKQVATTSAITMTRGTQNIWSLVLNEENTGIADLEGYYYQYKVRNYGEDKVVLDPYAKSMAAFDYYGVKNGGDKVGKGAFVDPSKVGPAVSAIGMSNLNDSTKGIDMVAYEVHTRDFTIDTGIENAGTFTGFKNYTDGLDHLQDLGITHVQLLPVQNFYTVDETDTAYKSGADAKGTDTNYNWGYDPHNYFSLEGWYSTDANDPYARIKEFKELVQELHNRNIGVIVDVVYNHTYQLSILNDVVPGVYHRKAGGSVPVGDPAVASENPMVRKMIVDSVKYYVEELGVDGFRFDLMGFMDVDTMTAIREAVGDNIILQGEAWDFTDLSADMKTVKGTDNYPHELNLAAFNDTTRDSYRGSKESSGFVTGNGADILKVKAGIIGNITGFDNGGKYAALKADKYDYDLFAKDTLETNLQFLTIHDGYTLWDKINVVVPKVEAATYEEQVATKVAAFKQAQAMLFTSQGKTIIQGGMEIARTKPLASEEDAAPDRVNANDANVVIDTTDTDPVNAKFHENSYRSVDDTNKFRWERKNREPYASMYQYTKGLIALKRNLAAFNMTNVEDIRNNIQFIGEKEPDVELAGYASWAEVPELTIVFKGINMEDVTDNTLYVQGELASVVETVTVAADGSFQISLTPEDIAGINLSAWGNPDAIDFKFKTDSDNWDLNYPQDGNVSIDYTTIGIKNLMLAEFSQPDRSVTVKAVTNHISFDTVPSLTVKFINAPEAVRGQTVWMMGEMYPASTIMEMATGTKPTQDEIVAYYGADSTWANGVAIDAEGNGEFTFTKEDINNFNLGAWGNGGDMDFVMVSEAGVDVKWTESYSDMGKNVIKASNIEDDNTITVDLSKIDHIPGDDGGQLWVAYTLKYGTEEFIVVHNAADDAATIEDELIVDDNWTVLLDSDEVDHVNGVANVDAGISLTTGVITVPAHTSVIFAK